MPWGDSWLDGDLAVRAGSAPARARERARAGLRAGRRLRPEAAGFRLRGRRRRPQRARRGGLPPARLRALRPAAADRRRRGLQVAAPRGRPGRRRPPRGRGAASQVGHWWSSSGPGSASTSRPRAGASSAWSPPRPRRITAGCSVASTAGWPRARPGMRTSWPGRGRTGSIAPSASWASSTGTSSARRASTRPTSSPSSATSPKQRSRPRSTRARSARRASAT